MNQRFTQLGLVSLAIVAGLPASAQTATTGALMGTVKDAKGLPVPGATVRITSGQISRTVVTNADGTFRLPLLNPGAMDISITKAGFSTINQKVDVSINETKTLNFKMVTEAEVTVVVAAQSVGVDTTTAQTGSNYSMDTIKAVPVSGRNMESLANLTPGVVGGGMGAGRVESSLSSSISGASGAENSYIVDGLSTTDMRYGGSGTSLVTDFIDQVEVQTGAFKPEYSALGGIFNVVTKSGSNTFRGSTWFTYDPRAWQAKPMSTESVVQDNPLNRYDVGAEVSGPLVQNRLFYFVGLSAQMSDNPESSTNLEGRAGSKKEITDYQFITKLNWFATPDLQFTFFANYNPTKDTVDTDYPNRGDSNIGRKLEGNSKNLNLIADWNVSSSAILSAKIGESYLEQNNYPSVPGAQIADRLWYLRGPGSPSTLPYPTTYFRGGTGFTSEADVKTRQAKVDFSYFTTNHQFKVGLSTQTSEFNQNEYIGAAPTGTDEGGNVRLSRISATDPSNAPIEIRLRQVAYNNAQSKSSVQAFYLQDTWELMPGLKLSYGARFEKQTLEDAAGIDYLKFDFGDQFQPRIGVIWDPNNDGQSKVLVNYARYHEIFPLRFGLRYRGGRYIYHDRFYNGTYNNATGAYTITTGMLDDDDYAGPYNDPPVMEGIKPPERTEYVVGYERNLKDGWSAGIHGKFRELKNPVEDGTPTMPDGTYVDRGNADGGQAILLNPRPGVMQWWTRPGSLSNATNGVSQLITWDSLYKEGFNRYVAVDITLERKTANTYLNFSYMWSRLYGTYEGLVSASNQQIDTNGTQSFDYPIFVGYGPLSTDRTHVLKLIGSQNYQLGQGTLTLGFNYSYYTGTPLSQLASHYGTTPPGDWTITPPLDYAGYGAGIPVDYRYGQFGRSPNLSNLDLRVEYTFKAGKFQIVPSLDVYNALNGRKATRLSNDYTLDNGGTLNPYWGQATDFQIGRRYRAGVKLRF